MNGTSDEEDDGISHDIDYSRPNTILPLYNSNKRTDIFKERVTLNEQDLSASGICIKRTRKYVNNTEGANNLELCWDLKQFRILIPRVYFFTVEECIMP